MRSSRRGSASGEAEPLRERYCLYLYRGGYQKRVSQGELRDDVIASLHADGLSIIESIRAVRTLYRVGLGDAKQIVTAHPVWAEVVRNTQPLHEKMIKVMMDAHVAQEVS